MSRPSSSQRFRARARAARLQALRPWGLVALGVGCAVAIGWVVLASGLLSVHRVAVHGTARVTEDEVMAALGQVKGEALLTLDTGRLAQRVGRIPGVRAVAVHREWPSTVTVVIRERTPIATVHRGDGWWLVDAQGVEFGPPQASPPRLRALKLPAPGEQSAQAARSAAEILAALPAPLLATVTAVEASSADSVELTLRSGATVVWGSSDRSADKARILATLVRRDAHVYDVSSPSVVTTR